jgi:N-acetylmuramoyl-L-alanine amidase
MPFLGTIFVESDTIRVSAGMERVSPRFLGDGCETKVSGKVIGRSLLDLTGSCAFAKCVRSISPKKENKKSLKFCTAAYALFNLSEISCKVNFIALMVRSKNKKFLLTLVLLTPFIFGGYIPNETMMPAFRMKKIVLDAGHGGKDPGNLGSRSREKDINLAVTLLVGKYIKENMPDVEVVYTRKDDSFPSLKERPQIANNNKADLFVSIHSNSAPNKSAFGTETFVMGTKHFEANFDIVKRENSVILLEDNYEENYEGFDPSSPESYMMFNLMSKVHFENSVSLADQIETQFRDRVGRKSRGVKQGPFYVLWTPSMPSVLVELGFLSNSEEERFLMSDAGKEYMASAIYRSIRDYKEAIESK